MNLRYRLIEVSDVEQLFVLRGSVRENVLTRDQLAEMGITPTSTVDAMSSVLKGYLCEVEGQTVGFSMANIQTREIAVIAVLPEFEGMGIGKELLRLSEKILWAAGCDSIWLWTWPNRSTRAVNLYIKCGWLEKEVTADRLYLFKNRPDSWSSVVRQPR